MASDFSKTPFPWWRFTSLLGINLVFGNVLIRTYRPMQGLWWRGAGVNMMFTLIGCGVLWWVIKKYSSQDSLQNLVWLAAGIAFGVTLVSFYMLGVSLNVRSCLAGSCLPSDVWLQPFGDALRLTFWRSWLWMPMTVVNFLLLRK